MGFVFRLESVRRYRSRIVDSQGRKVAAAKARLLSVNQALAELEQTIARQLDCDRAGGHLDIGSLESRAGWLAHLRRQQQQLQTSLQEARNSLDEARDELQAAWRDLEVLEQLRAKKLASWRDEEERRERKELDEIGSQRRERARRQEATARVV